MHSYQKTCHHSQICQLKFQEIPLVRRARNVEVGGRKQTERINNQSQIYPKEEQAHKPEGREYNVPFNVSLEIEPSSCQENITRIVDDEDHHTNCDIVAHHREQDEIGSNTVMEHPLIKFPLFLPSDENQLKDGKNMNAQVKHEISFQVISVGRGPLGIIFEDLPARSLPSSSRGKPILSSKNDVAENSCCDVKHCVKT